MRVSRGFFPAAVVVVALFAACSADPDNRIGLTDPSKRSHVNDPAYQYCLQGIDGYQYSCGADFGSVPMANDTGWKDKVRWVDSVLNAADQTYMQLLSLGFNKVQARHNTAIQIGGLNGDPAGCDKYWSFIGNMTGYGSGHVGVFDATDNYFTNGLTSTTEFVDWQEHQWGFAEQLFAQDIQLHAGTSALGETIGETMVHAMIHGVDGKGNSSADEAYVNQRTAECGVNWNENLRMRVATRTQAPTLRRDGL
jgi:hypothetical protein